MAIRYRLIGTNVTLALLVSLTGCGKIFVRAPAEGQAQIQTPYTLEAQKNSSAACRYVGGSFRAYLNKDQPDETEITSAFSRPSDSNIWTAADYSLPVGTHQLYVEARFTGALCWGKKDADRRELEVSSPPPPAVAALDAARAAIAQSQTSIDLDGDGFNEYTRTYDTGGALIREELDIDEDGTAEVVWDHAVNPRTFTVDEDGNGVFEYSEEAQIDGSNPNRFHVTITRDVSDDGIPDDRITYTVDSAATDIEIDHFSDTDQDGTFTATYTSTTTREQTYGGIDVETQGPWACTDQQAQQINDAYDKMLSEGWSCLNGMSARLALEFLLTQARSTIKVSCLDTPTPCGSVDTYRARWRWLFGFDELPILLGSSNFDGSQTCRPLDQVLFHELLHYVVGLHEHGNGLDDPGDRVFGCVNTCYGDALGNPGNSQTCAACLGKENGTSRCNAYPQAACTGDVPTYCKCNEQIYPSEVECAAQCPVNLGCFSGQCQVLGPCR